MAANSGKLTCEGLRLAGDGQQDAPALSFSKHAGTGLFRFDITGSLALACDGQERLVAHDTGAYVVGTMSVNDGAMSVSGGGTASAAKPAYAAGVGGNNGLFSAGTGTVSLSAGGAERLRLSSQGATIMTGGLTSLSGAAAAPSINWSTAPNSGLYSGAAGSTSASSLGSEKLRVSSTGAEVLNGSLRVPSGPASTPSIWLSTSADSGLFSPGANQTSVSSAGVEKLRVTPAGTEVVGGDLTVASGSALKMQSGAAAAPSIGWSDAGGGTGLYSDGIGTTSVASAGAQKMRVNSGGVQVMSSGALRVPGGTAAAPGLQVGPKTGTGILGHDDGYVALVTNGIEGVKADGAGRLVSKEPIFVDGLLALGINPLEISGYYDAAVSLSYTYTMGAWLMNHAGGPVTIMSHSIHTGTFGTMELTENSSLGIGRSPGVMLDLNGDTARKLTGTNWVTGSDARVKEGIIDADLNLCYDNVKKLRLRRFAWNTTVLPEKPAVVGRKLDNAAGGTLAPVDRHQLGWIAQEVKEVFPHSVFVTKDYGLDDFHNLDTDQLTKTMYGAVQMLQSLVEAADDEGQRWDDRAAALRARVAALEAAS